MPKRPATLAVYANPYLHLDHEGRPAGACPTDPEHTGEERRWVGAHLCPERTKKHDLKTKELRESVRARLHEHPQDTVFVFADEPVAVPTSHYYLERLRHGELIPANAQTARYAGIAWEEPKVRIKRARIAAAIAWLDQHEELPEWCTPEELADASLNERQAAALAACASESTAADAPPADQPAPAPADTSADEQGPELASHTTKAASASEE